MYFLIVIVLQIVFGILGSLITSWFSRQREFRPTLAAPAWRAVTR
jgi:Zn-dependent protease with chaperone function